MIVNMKTEDWLAAWRNLTGYDEPRGGESDIDRLNNLLAWPRTRTFDHVRATVESW